MAMLDHIMYEIYTLCGPHEEMHQNIFGLCLSLLQRRGGGGGKGRKDGGREGGRAGGKEGRMEGGRAGGREGGPEEGRMEGRREGGPEGGKEGGREGGPEGERETQSMPYTCIVHTCVCMHATRSIQNNVKIVSG